MNLENNIFALETMLKKNKRKAKKMNDLKNYLLGDYRDVLTYSKMLERNGLTKMTPLIITCAITGGMHGKESTPYLPEEPDEQAQQCLDAYNAGAVMCHIHARDPKNAWSTSLAPERFMEVNAKVREKCPDLIINNTCVGGYRYIEEENKIAPNRLMYSIDAKPEVASVDITCYSMIRKMKERPAPLRSPREAFNWNYNYICTQSQALDTVVKLREQGIKPEFEMFSMNDIKYIRNMAEQDAIDSPYWVQMLFGGSGVIPCAEQLQLAMKLLPEKAMLSTIGVGACQNAIITLSILLGNHVRVGLEDNFFYGPHELATSNAQMVERVVRIAKELGRPIATVDQAREMLGLGAPREYTYEAK